MACGPVLVADEDASFRAAVTELVERAGLTAAAAATGADALAAARADEPSVAVLDVHLPGPSGYDVCRELRDTYGERLPIFFVSDDRNEASDRVAGLLLGADDYLAKPIDPDELLARIRRAIARSQALPAVEPVVPAEADDVPHGLTSRELQVLRMLALGLTPRQIADRLTISPKTVASHLQRILMKLGVHSRVHAVAKAYEEGLVGPDLVGHEDIGNGRESR